MGYGTEELIASRRKAEADAKKYRKEARSLRKALRYLSGGTNREWGWVSEKLPCFCYGSDIAPLKTVLSGHTDRCLKARKIVGTVERCP
jgi:hypothetical protein